MRFSRSEGTSRARCTRSSQVSSWSLRSPTEWKERGEEGITQIADASLDAPLLVSAGDGARLGSEVIVTGELEEARIKSDELSLALKDGALEIVVQDGPRHAAERRERVEVTAEKALGCLIEIEAREECARPREHHEKAREAAFGASNRDGSEGGPVDLGLLAGQNRES